MADITWPTDGGLAFAVLRYTEQAQWDVEISHSRNGRIFTTALPGMRWIVRLQVPDDTVVNLVERRRLEALLMRLRGGANRLLLWHLLTPEPLGTMRGTPTLASTATAGSNTVSITGAAGKTLLRGDRIGIGEGGQRVMVVADVELNGVVTVEPALRATATAGAAVVWNRPTSRLVLRNAVNDFPSQSTVLPGFEIELVEE